MNVDVNVKCRYVILLSQHLRALHCSSKMFVTSWLALSLLLLCHYVQMKCCLMDKYFPVARRSLKSLIQRYSHILHSSCSFLVFVAQESILERINTSSAFQRLIEDANLDPHIKIDAKQSRRSQKRALRLNAFFLRAQKTCRRFAAILITSSLGIPYVFLWTTERVVFRISSWVPFWDKFGPSNAEKAILKRCEAFFEWPSTYVQGSRYCFA